jgi:hypothetical protein
LIHLGAGLDRLARLVGGASLAPVDVALLVPRGQFDDGGVEAGASGRAVGDVLGEEDFMERCTGISYPSERPRHRAVQIGHDLLLALLEGIRVGGVNGEVDLN